MSRILLGMLLLGASTKIVFLAADNAMQRLDHIQKLYQIAADRVNGDATDAELETILQQLSQKMAEDSTPKPY